MKRWHSILVFAVLVASSVATSVGSYNAAGRRAELDLNEALGVALAVQRSTVITPDTLALFRSNIHTAELRKSSRIVVCYAEGERMAYRAECLASAVWSISDQRPAAFLAVVSMLWAVGCVFRFYPRHGCAVYNNVPAVAAAKLRGRRGTAKGSRSIVLDEDTGIFHDANGEEIPFTPMQQQLMAMFLASGSGVLSKSDICDALWPGKEDASETLYALMGRIKPVVEKHSGMKIESLRGRAYRLVERK